MRRSIHSATALALAVSAVVGLGLGAITAAGPATAAAFTQTKTITRDRVVNGVTQNLDTRTFSLSVSDTTNLRGLQQIVVSWTGAHPTGGTVPDPNSVIPGVGGNDATSQEYPVVLLECRGVDSATAPAVQQLDPTTCWTSSPYERYQGDGSGTGFPPWRLDPYATAAQRAAVVGAPDSYPAACPFSRPAAEYWVPLKASNGTIYHGGPFGCAGTAPEASGGLNALSFPSNETFAATAPEGRGASKFTVFSSDDNASLGCSEAVACALVAVPIMGLSCDAAVAGFPPEDLAPTSTVADDALAACLEGGHYAPGQSQVGSDSALAVRGSLWWAASNWRNRISVPLSFAPVGDPCSITGKNGEVDIYGSELMTQATSQWGPHFCGDPKLFTLKHVQLGEPQARNLLAQSSVEAAFSSYAPTGTYSSPVVNAPVALTGFAISFSVDDATGAEVKSLKLTPRLLAKLLTESYPASRTLQANYSALTANPLNMSLDPEFIALNPGVARGTPNTDAASTLLALSSDSDVIYALTSYINDDPEARAWLGGTPDPWGMVVNHHYNVSNKEIALPTSSWRLLDTVTDPQRAAITGSCPEYAQLPYLPLVASPVSSLSKITLAMEFYFPNSQTRCSETTDLNGQFIRKLTRLDRQSPGHRFMLGVTSLGEASRYQLNTAALQTKVAPGTPAKFTSADGRTFVGPTDPSLQAAAKLLAPEAATQTWQIPSDAIRTKPEGAGAYPGTMVVYTEVPTKGLSPTDASRYAQFLRFAAGDGQSPGTGTGQLPPGYLPMTSANGLGALVAYTRTAADAVAAQSGTAPPIVAGVPSPPLSPSSAASSPSTSVSGGNQSRTSSPTSTASTSPDGSSAPGGGGSAIGPLLRSGSGTLQSGDSAKAPVSAPEAAIKGALAALGKTVAIISHLAGSIVWWLVSIAAGAFAGAGAFYVVARRRGVKLGLRGLIAAIKEWLSSVVARRRAPR